MPSLIVWMNFFVLDIFLAMGCCCCSFLARLKHDEALQHQISQANNEDHVVEIALSKGFVLDKEKFWLYESKDFKRCVERRGFYSKQP